MNRKSERQFSVTKDEWLKQWRVGWNVGYLDGVKHGRRLERDAARKRTKPPRRLQE